MPRVARIVVPGIPHHVTQRGNRKATVFEREEDFAKYKLLLGKYCAKYKLDIWAYCLMTNHVHLVAVPARPDSLGRALRDTHQTHALLLNRRMGETGHLWQGRYYSCALDEEHLWAAVRYVESNPVRAGIVTCAEDWPHSSAAARCGLRGDPLLSEGFPPPGMVKDWSQWLREDPGISEERINTQSHTGRPCGGAAFHDRIEALLGRPVKKRRPGRKGMLTEIQ
jgi:putative transposase